MNHILPFQYEREIIERYKSRRMAPQRIDDGTLITFYNRACGEVVINDGTYYPFAVVNDKVYWVVELLSKDRIFSHTRQINFSGAELDIQTSISTIMSYPEPDAILGKPSRLNTTNILFSYVASVFLYEQYLNSSLLAS